MAKSKKSESMFKNVVGTPTVMMLPARNYKFRVSDQEYTVTIPRKGKYADLDKELFSEDSGEFNVMQYSKKDKANIVYLPSLTKILFATSQYPDLEDNQAFTPIALIIKKDVVEIVGKLIEMVKED